MMGRSRKGPRVGLAVLAAIGVLAVAGRLLAPGLRPPVASLAGDVLAPPRPVPGGMEFGQPLSGLAVTPSAVWIAHGATVDRLDPRTLRATASLRVPAVSGDGVVPSVRGLTAAGGAVWASLTTGLVRIDAATARVAAVVPVAAVGPVAVGAGGVWVVCCGGETYLGAGGLVRVDPASNRVVARIPLPGLADAVGAGNAGVWVRAAAGPVWKVDPASNQVVATLPVPGGLGGTPGSVLVGRDAVWVSDPASATVLRIDPFGDRVTGWVAASGAALAATTDGTVVATSAAGLLRLGAGSVRSLHLDGINAQYTTALAAEATTMWVAEDGVLLHVDHLDWA